MNAPLEFDAFQNHSQKPKTALLVSVYKSGKEMRQICEEHLDELALLSETYGVQVAHKVSCPLRRFDAATFVTEGKLEELVQMAKDHQVDAVIFDEEISPSQQRNLEKAFGRRVMDRTEVILGVFADRAETREARLQVELAQVKYQAPRLRRLWTHLSRQSGTGSSGAGGAYLKGEGEKQIEIDRRILKRKIDQLQKEIEVVKSHRETQRTSRERSEIPVFSIIGYTNAGKSTLLNALTDAGVFVENKLFATLDTTTRKFTLPNHQDILIIDTVGFIRKLPHLLVAAFKSTLEEALHSDILLHLVDVSHSMAEEQAATTFEVLKELKAENIPIITVLNKIDLCKDSSVMQKLRLKYPKTVMISALNRLGFDELLSMMIEERGKQAKIVNMRIPQSEYALVSEVRRLANVIDQDYEGNDVILKAELTAPLQQKYKAYISIS